jgi:hypothetical protein
MPSPSKTRPKKPTTKCRAAAEVKADKETKKAAQEAKKAAQEAKKQAKKVGIERAAAFESAAIVNEDLVDATPRPKFNTRSSSLVTGTEKALTEANSDDEMSDNRNLDYIPDLADNDLTDSGDLVEQTPMPSSKKRKLAPKIVDKPAAKVRKQQPLRRTYAFTDILAACSHEEPESGNETERQTNQQSQSMADQDVPEDSMDIYVSDDPATAEQPVPRRSFAVADSAPEGPGRQQDKAHNGTKPKNRQQTQKVADHRLPAKLMDNIVDDFPAESNSGPPVKRVKTKGMDEVEEKKTKTKKTKESIRDAIEAAQEKTMDNESRKQPSHNDNKKGKKVTTQKGKEGRMTPEKATRSVLLCSPFTDIMLTLDHSTLFYWNLTSNPQASSANQISSSVNSWAKTVPANAKPPSHAPSHAAPTNTGRTMITVPPLTNASSRSTGRSVLTNTITITGKRAPSVRVKPDPDSIDFHDGALSDHDEIMGQERDAAMLSPPKGKKRLNSEVSLSQTNYLSNYMIQ